jgi:chromosome segregation ATPase
LCDLYDGFEAHLADLGSQLASARTSLAAAEDDGDAAAIARNEVEAIQAQIGEVADARSKVLASEHRKQAKIERFSAWRAAVAEALAGQHKVDSFEPLIREAQEAVDLAEQAFSYHQRAPAKLKKWNEDRKRLEENLQAASRELIEAKDKTSQLRRERLAASEELNRFGGPVFRARQLAPPNPQYESSRATLGGVSL